MSDAEAMTATLSAQSLIALSDSELAQFMEKHRHSDGNVELPVNGWSRLSKEVRSCLAERLKAQRRGLAQHPTIHSHQLDLEQLNTRLCEASAQNSTPLCARSLKYSRSRSPTPFVDFEAEARVREVEAYHDLVGDGGRPLYQIDLLYRVSTSPDEYHYMLRPWQNPRDPMRNWEVFQRQWDRWQNFRKWQLDNRGLEDDDGGFPAYVDMMKRIYEKDGYAKGLAEIEADTSCLKSGWKYHQWERQRQRNHMQEHGCNGFPDYIEAVRRRLARHDYTQSFHLKEDPGQQDELTTWIEYLNFEYWWQDKYTDSVEHLRPSHDEAWRDLVDSRVLKPHETQEYLRTIGCAMRHEAEETRAHKDVQTAKSEAEKVYQRTQLDSNRHEIASSKRLRMLRAATDKMYRAYDRRDRTVRRCHLVTEFVRTTFEYEDNRKKAIRQANLVTWVLEQIPLIEADLVQDSKPDAGSNVSRKRKRKDVALDDDGPKRQKKPHRRLDLPSFRSTTLGSEGKDRGTTFLPADDGEQFSRRDGAQKPRARQSYTRRSLRLVNKYMTVSQGQRRSARLAARRNEPSPMLKAPPPRRTR